MKKMTIFSSDRLADDKELLATPVALLEHDLHTDQIIVHDALQPDSLVDKNGLGSETIDVAPERLVGQFLNPEHCDKLVCVFVIIALLVLTVCVALS